MDYKFIKTYSYLWKPCNCMKTGNLLMSKTQTSDQSLSFPVMYWGLYAGTLNSLKNNVT